MKSALLRRLAAATWERDGVVGALSQALAILIGSAVAIPLLLVTSVVVIGSIMFAIMGLILYAATLFPAYSAEVYVKERETTVTLAFYRLWNSDGPMATEENSGRSLTIRTPDGPVTHKICGDDWAHRARTSVYLVGDHDLAVVGPHQCDYLIATRPVAVSRALKGQSRDWIYLGAFDIVDHDNGVGRGLPPHVRVLRFIPADEEEECIEGEAGQATVRNDARRGSCSDIRHRDP